MRTWNGARLLTSGIAAVLAPAPVSAKTAAEPSYVLALSWQAAFCEFGFDRAECKSQTADRFDATHLSLHGLWPQSWSNVYCKVVPELTSRSENSKWSDLPPVALSRQTQARLERAMPGTHSHLERHEWIKHGTCYPGRSAEAYFTDALRLVDAINGSSVRDFVAARIGKTVTDRDLRSAFDDAFGLGAGERVRLACKNDGGRRLIVEVTVGLGSDVGSGKPIGDLIRASKPTDPGCPRGMIDRVGLQ